MQLSETNQLSKACEMRDSQKDEQQQQAWQHLRNNYYDARGALLATVFLLYSIQIIFFFFFLHTMSPPVKVFSTPSLRRPT